jgi:hypothetical protein
VFDAVKAYEPPATAPVRTTTAAILPILNLRGMIRFFMAVGLLYEPQEGCSDEAHPLSG